jgi:hypothetical protein
MAANWEAEMRVRSAVLLSSATLLFACAEQPTSYAPGYSSYAPEYAAPDYPGYGYAPGLGSYGSDVFTGAGGYWGGGNDRGPYWHHQSHDWNRDRAWQERQQRLTPAQAAQAQAALQQQQQQLAAAQAARAQALAAQNQAIWQQRAAQQQAQAQAALQQQQQMAAAQAARAQALAAQNQAIWQQRAAQQEALSAARARSQRGQAQ